ncbi:YajG family lipoprotein [Bacterioplanoides pacificum]|uniref:YajG family lipoprotein n=1 Tax=Bacterioplanoides pacificum TaxID=1171596 RepID=A0ABV7VRW1_9GAMM
MVNSLRTLLLTAALASGLTGCVLAPQMIELNESYPLTAAQVHPQRDALVRVVDRRQRFSAEQIGHRGGRLPENSPLSIQAELKDVLTQRLQNSMSQLGFGGSSPLPPLKVQLDINDFIYTCNEGALVNECGMQMAFYLTVISDSQTFTKPYTIKESRRLAASPNVQYNQQWVNEVLDKLWAHIFSDHELMMALNVQR